ncbi:glycine cleavage T C-terminal barrel domain-containing protein [Paraburkholderia pallida]|uniref:FAD-dependent oxidoreductase n=1 Tax=Paraburkholderia pallida TaxID=2547399 RepID=A0A4P7CZM0_9BURK|nr:glycine cleavage T C-terminal barrel domain-containing protein [Paraburkholderia pallida]QBQ99571.1 FAD-dependent oxidoreductase [Paraburkholderia pallida]
MRLAPHAGEWIDRSKQIEFGFEGQRYVGFAGDTVTSALWASEVSVLGRSFKYHRPRGVLSLANHDVNAMFQDGARLNVRADVTELIAGANWHAVNTTGGVAADRGRWMGKLAPFLPVGFYYKAFYSKRWFPRWERMFRKMAGLGTVDLNAPHVRTPKRYGFCDVLVIGAGPSGLAAALEAAQQGADVVIVDENARSGGSGTYQAGGEMERLEAVRALEAQVRAHPRVRMFNRTLAAAYYADHWVPLVEPGRITKMRAKAVVVASGAFEQPAVFHNNDLPGVMLASAAQRLAWRYGVAPGQRAVVLGANADAYRAALDMLERGIKVKALIDMRATHRCGALARELEVRGVEVIGASCVTEAVPDTDGARLAAVRVGPMPPAGMSVSHDRTRQIECDTLLMSVGWAPAANLLYQAGTAMRYDTHVEQFVPERLPDGVFACGRVNGVHTFESKLQDGRRAGAQAAGHVGAAALSDGKVSFAIAAEPESPSHAWPIVPHPAGKNFVDFDEDLQLKDFENAVQEGFDNIELLKRFSTNGMGPSQGKHSNMNGLRILARLTGKAPQEVGTTTARPFFHPVPMALLAGRGFNPERRTPIHAQHERLGAKWMPAGVWQRPEYYAVAGKDRARCIQEEVQAVRTGVGMIDVGTLGKLEARGPQAAQFLERVYVSKYAGLKPGMTRYALMCDEAGVVIDDGVVARLSDDHFYFTTTTSGAAAIYRELSRLNTIWGLDCGIVNVTGAYAAINLAGPYSRAVLAKLVDLDLSSETFPYLGIRVTGIALGANRVPARLMRVGFVGEWGYEIHIPAEYGAALWSAIQEAGKEFGIRPFGVEAQRLLRLEKGHVIVSQDTDGLTTPRDAAMEWAVKMDKPFFVGQRSLQAIDSQPQPQRLVGFALDDGVKNEALRECHLAIEGTEIAGRVTSVSWSETLQKTIGLAFVRPAMATPGTRIRFRLSDGTMVSATVVPTPFYDPDNARQKDAAPAHATAPREETA